jgi:hypothetical protein
LKEILRNLYSHILTFGGGGGSRSFDFDQQGSSGSTEFDLFLFMLLTNRPELAKLFWVRDGERRAFSLLQSAGFGVYFCRQVIVSREAGYEYESLTSHTPLR